jgi:uroporphyrinogen III methyltransferase/synthase
MSARPGVVYLVGAGPGDPGLVTVRALELVSSADVILHDRLIPAGLLQAAREDAELVYVGKEPGSPTMPQEEIASLLAEKAREDKSVVRLKGGDPFVFGRGGEEAEALSVEGIPFEVVPGVTAGVAAPAYGGIPVTHRDEASAVAFVTGHEDPEKDESALDWEALARFPGTLVLYMGVKRLGEIASRLASAGRDGAEPAAVIERGTLDGQRTVSAPLSEIATVVADAGLRPPAVTVIGPVAARAEQLAWLERRPLHGKRVVVTRARAQASGLAKRLRGLGADVVELPAIRIESLAASDAVRDALADLSQFDLIALTSANAVDLLFEALGAAGLDARALAGRTIAAVGAATGEALASHGIAADIVATTSSGQGLADALSDTDVSGMEILLPGAKRASDTLPDALGERGAKVLQVALYETVAEEPDPETLEAAREADYVTFTSSSTVRNLLKAMGSIPAGARVISIGPQTSATAREAGVEVHAEAERHDVDGLVEALLADAG